MDAQIADEAQREEERRREAEEAARLQAEREQREKEYAQLTADYHHQLAQLEDRIYAMVGPIEDAIQNGRKVYAAGRGLGHEVKWRIKFDIQRVLCQALAPILHPAIDWVAPSRSRSLVPGRILPTPKYQHPTYPSTVKTDLEPGALENGDPAAEFSEFDLASDEDEGANHSNVETN